MQSKAFSIIVVTTIATSTTMMPGVIPSAAAALPPDLGGVAKANADNTVSAHVWNIRQAPAHAAVVEFYWFNPTLGFSGSDAV